MDRPLLYDGFSGAGGAAKGFMNAGFRVIGIDIKPQPHYCGDGFIQMDFFEFYARVQAGEYPQPAAWHCSPPCQGYSIMHNLPWLKGREYPLLILPTLELLEASGKPYVLENVMGARHGAKGLAKRGIEAHGLKAGWLCGGMFSLPFYRHRLFATNWFWLAPGHPKHQGTILKGRNLGDREHMVTFSKSEDARGIASWPNRRGDDSGHGLTLRPGYEHVPFSMPTLTNWQNGAEGVGIGYAKGWKLAAEAMGIDWPVTRAELTQMIPPAYTFFLGARLMEVVSGGTKTTPQNISDNLAECPRLSGQQPEAIARRRSVVRF